MTFKLSATPKVKYSKRDHVVFAILNRRTKPTDVATLAEAFFKAWKGPRPYFSDVQVGSQVRALSKKISFNDEPFELVRERPAGQREVLWKLKSKD
jgi:hypothetical protein